MNGYEIRPWFDHYVEEIGTDAWLEIMHTVSVDEDPALLTRSVKM